eukprot:1588507-Pyramimonas_sp.AAC.1
MDLWMYRRQAQARGSVCACRAQGTPPPPAAARLCPPAPPARGHSHSHSRAPGRVACFAQPTCQRLCQVNAVCAGSASAIVGPGE